MNLKTVLKEFFYTESTDRVAPDSTDWFVDSRVTVALKAIPDLNNLESGRALQILRIQNKNTINDYHDILKRAHEALYVDCTALLEDDIVTFFQGRIKLFTDPNGDFTLMTYKKAVIGKPEIDLIKLRIIFTILLKLNKTIKLIKEDLDCTGIMRILGIILDNPNILESDVEYFKDIELRRLDKLGEHINALSTNTVNALERHKRELREYLERIESIERTIILQEAKTILAKYNSGEIKTILKSFQKHIIVKEDLSNFPLVITAPLSIDVTDAMTAFNTIKHELITPKEFSITSTTTNLAIFIDQVLIKAKYTIDLVTVYDIAKLFDGELYVKATSSRIYNEKEFPNKLLNPHHHKFNCFGSYKTVLKETAKKGDLVMLLTTLIQATSSLNYLDMTVMCAFVAELIEYKIPIFKDVKTNEYKTFEEVARSSGFILN